MTDQGLAVSTRPVDVISSQGEWLASFRYEPFLNRWFVVDPGIAAEVVLLDNVNVPHEVLVSAEKDETNWTRYAYRAPIKLQIQLNRVCNYHCSICYAGSSKKEKLESRLTFAEIEQLLPRLKAWGVLRVNFVGGEVFLRSDFPEIVEATHAHRLLVSCITNGRVAGSKIDRYESVLRRLWNTQVSCNGVGKSYENEYRTTDWEAAKHSIINVLHATRRNVLSYVITPGNYTGISEFLDFAAEANPSIVKFGTICCSGRAAMGVSSNYFSYILPLARKQIDEGRIRHANLRIQSQLDCGSETPMWEDYANGYRPFEFYYAPEGRDGLYLQTSGDVYPFPLLADQPAFRLGNVRHDELRELWEKHPVLDRIRQVRFENSDCGRLGCDRVCGLWNRSYAIAWSGRLDGKVPCHRTAWK